MYLSKEECNESIPALEGPAGVAVDVAADTNDPLINVKSDLNKESCWEMLMRDQAASMNPVICDGTESVCEVGRD